MVTNLVDFVFSPWVFGANEWTFLQHSVDKNPPEVFIVAPEKWWTWKTTNSHWGFGNFSGSMLNFGGAFDPSLFPFMILSKELAEHVESLVDDLGIEEPHRTRVVAGAQAGQ